MMAEELDFSVLESLGKIVMQMLACVFDFPEARIAFLRGALSADQTLTKELFLRLTLVSEDKEIEHDEEDGNNQRD